MTNKALDALMQRCREDSHKPTYADLVELLQEDATRIAVPDIDYDALIEASAAHGPKWAQGTNLCAAFARGAEWFRGVVLASALDQPAVPPEEEDETIPTALFDGEYAGDQESIATHSDHIHGVGQYVYTLPAGYAFDTDRSFTQAVHRPQPERVALVPKK